MMTRRSARIALPGRLVTAGAALVLTIGGGTWALAQPRSRASRTPSKATEEPAASASTPAPSGSSGPVPAPASEESADGGKLSPLNPAANEFSDGGLAAEPPDYDRLLADLAALRARVAAVSDTLFHSRITIGIEATGGHARIAALSVSIDDGVVWTSPTSFKPESETVVYDHAVAPGHHALTVDVERRDDRDDVFRTSQRSRFVVDVPNDQRLAVDLSISDDSNMGGDFPTDHKGRYDLRIRARAKAEVIGK